MKYIVGRCMKRPGLIDRARTYYLEFNDKGLYIIAIGPAGQKPHFPRKTLVNEAAQALVKGLVQKMEEKMELEILDNEQRIANGQLALLAMEKKSYVVPSNEIKLFQSKREGELIKIVVKSAIVSITLFASEGYLEEVLAMETAIGKR